MRTLRVGIIGFGMSARVFHAPLIESASGLKISIIVTTDPDKQEAARRSYPMADIVPTADALFDRCDDLDLIVITSPNGTHVPLGRRAIQRGVPVVVDKPVALSSDEANEMAMLAADRGVCLAVFQNRRWDSDYLTLVHALERGVVGDAFHLISRFAEFSPTAGSGWRNSSVPETGGGVLLDLGPHIVDQAVQLLGHVLSVFAEVDQRRKDANLPDDIFISLEHENGARSHLYGSVLGCGPAPRFHLQGTRGSVVVHDRDIQEQQLEDGIRPGDEEWGLLPPGVATLTTVDRTERIEIIRGRQEHFYQMLRDHLWGVGEPPVPCGDPGYVLQVLEAASISNNENRRVFMTEHWESRALLALRQSAN